jgi:hypothetical protein
MLVAVEVLNFISAAVLEFFSVFLGAFAKLQKRTISSIMSVSPAVSPYTWNNSATTKRKIHI